mmetsp:Transcript_43255/g.85013  ORF Transcript_43255/g.85013 Transcript_43255/m.85013 type:complete len:157 (-) Transcript_43255:88-558(-)
MNSEIYWPDRFKKLPMMKRQVPQLVVIPEERAPTPTWTRRKLTLQSPSPNLDVTTPGATAASPFTGKRCTKFTDDVVSSGPFNTRRLRITPKHNHLPGIPLNKNVECQFHKWCLKDKLGKVVRVKEQIFCPTCKVSLCLPCYSVFMKYKTLEQLKL